MEEELEKIVQNMIDAGESEDNIAMVIREYDSEKSKVSEPKGENVLETTQGTPLPKGVRAGVESGDSDSPSASMNSFSGSKKTNPFSSQEERIELEEEAGQRLIDNLKAAGETEFEIGPEQVTKEALKIKEERRLKKAEGAVNSIKKAETEKEQRSYLGNLFENLKQGSAELGIALSSIPETLYDLAAIPQNAVAEIFGIEDLKASSNKFKGNFDVNNPILDYYLEESEKIQEGISEFNEKYESTSVYENIKGGNYQDAFELLGSGITQSAPISLSMMMGGAATSLGKAAVGSTVALTGAERVRMEDDPSTGELEKTLKSLGLAGAESVFGVATSGSMGKVYKDIILKEGKEKGTQVFKNGIIQMYQTALKKYGGLTGAVGEGVEEVATTVTQNLINGDPIGQGVEDAFLLGVGSGGVYGAPINVMQVRDKFKKGYQKRQIKKIVESPDNNLKRMSDAFDPNISEDIDDVGINLIEKEGSLEALEDELNQDVKDGVITEEYKEAHLEKYYNASKGLSKTKTVPFDSKQKAQAVNLISKKERLEADLKSMDNVLGEPKKQEIEEINNQLRELIGVAGKEAQPRENKAGQTQGFFSDVVQGKSDKYKPAKAFEYSKEFEGNTKEFQENYDLNKGNFDEHIATSIPTFRETQVQKGSAIVETFKDQEGGALVYDIGGSEGGFGKAITETSGGSIRTVNIDPNSDMKEAFNKRPVEGAEFVDQAFFEGFDDKVAFKPEEKADVVHESMVFQFITKDRGDYINEVSDNYLKDDGLFITEEKFKMDDENIYSENERLKNENYKPQYYTEAQQKLKGEEVLVGMDKNQANYNEYISQLKEKFDFVETYWSAGNFKGVVASNSKEKMDSFLQSVGDTSNEFTASVPRGKTTEVKSAPEGNFINVGMVREKTNEEVSLDEIKKNLPEDVEIVEESVVDVTEEEASQGKEKTASFKLSRPLTNQEAGSLMEATNQLALPQISNGQGVMFGTQEWGDFNPEFFSMPDKTKLSEKTTDETKDKGTDQTGEDTSQPDNVSTKQRAKQQADRLREKFKTGNTLKDSLSNLSSGVPKGLLDAAWDASVEAVAQTIEAGGTVAQAIQEGMKKMRSSKWYKNLSKEGKKEAEELFTKDLKKEVGFDYKNATTEEIFAESRREAEQARSQASRANKPLKEKLSDALDKFVEESVDRQFSVKKAFNKLGMGKVVDYMVTKAGASSLAKFRVEKAYKKTFDGLTNREIELLEEIIDNRRIIAIDENRADRNLDPVKHKNGNNKDKAEARLEAYKEQLGKEAYGKLFERSDNFFSEYKSLLQEMKDEGLISQDLYDKFAEVNYVPREFLDFMENMDGDFLISELEKVENIPLSANQIKTMKGGYEGNNLMDAWYLLQKSILTRTKAVFSNKLNKTFRDEFLKTKAEVDALREKESLTKAEAKKVRDFERVENKVKVDEVVGETDGGNPKYKLGDNMKGFSSLYFYENGVKNRLLVEDGLFERLTDTNNQYMNSKVKQNVALVSGTSGVKTFATGNNPFFFITNTPRDFLFALSFSDAYGNEVVSNSFKLARDTYQGVKSVVSKSADYQKYLEYGGGMDFLALQGKYSGKGWTKSIVDGVMSQKNQDRVFRNRFKKAMDNFNLASEVGIRMAVFNRTVKKELGNRDMNSLPKDEVDHIYTKAVRSARELTDFNQGGRATKAADAAIPYLNAATQGTRAAFEAVGRDVKNKKGIGKLGKVSRIVQITGYTTAATLTSALGLINLFRDDEDETIKGLNNGQIYLETIQGVSQYDLENYYILPKGKKDGKGNWEYYRIAKAQSLSPIINLTEHYMRKALAESSGGIYKGEAASIIKNTVEKNIIPIELTPTGIGTRIPLVNASYAMSGIDAYTGNPLSWDRGKIPEQLEGIDDDRVEDFYKAFGNTLGESPVRLKGAVESYITTPNTNPYISMVYALGNLTTSDITAHKTYNKLGDDMLRTLSSRVSKTTSEYNSIAKLQEKASKEVVEAYKDHILLEKKVREVVSNYKTGKTTRDEVVKEIRKTAESRPEDAALMKRWINSEIDKKQLKPIVSTLKFTRNKKVRALIMAEKYGDAFLNPKSLEGVDREVFIQLKKNNVIDSETVKYYKGLYKD